ncbi:hypothetical protein ACJX0J_015057, partial [Zea mays]
LVDVKALLAGKDCGFVTASAEETIRMLNGNQLGGKAIKLSWADKQVIPVACLFATFHPSCVLNSGGGGGFGRDCFVWSPHTLTPKHANRDMDINYRQQAAHSA